MRRTGWSVLAVALATGIGGVALGGALGERTGPAAEAAGPATVTPGQLRATRRIAKAALRRANANTKAIAALSTGGVAAGGPQGAVGAQGPSGASGPAGPSEALQKFFLNVAIPMGDLVSVAETPLPAGAYVATARLGPAASSATTVTCQLGLLAAGGGKADTSSATLSAGGSATLVLTVAHTLSRDGTARLSCGSSTAAASSLQVRIVAVRVGSVTNLP
jgi:hypothetical protein